RFSYLRYFSTTSTRSATRHPHLVSPPVPTVSSHRLGQRQLTPLQHPLASRVILRFGLSGRSGTTKFGWPRCAEFGNPVPRTLWMQQWRGPPNSASRATNGLRFLGRT